MTEPTLIRENSFTPVGDDQVWKADELRFDRDVIEKLQELENRMTAVEGVVN